MAATRLALAAVAIVCVISAVGCTGTDGSLSARDDGRLEALEQCADSFESSLRTSLGTPPTFTEIRDAVRWTKSHLPNEVALALERAGVAAKREAEPHTFADLATNKDDFMKRLYRVTARELSSLEKYRKAGCGNVVTQELSNSLNLVLHLSDGTLQPKFDALGLDDSYYIENAFLRMLTLEASGVDWDERWFSGAKF